VRAAKYIRGPIEGIIVYEIFEPFISGRLCPPPADFIVYATGYRRLTRAGAILSSEIIERLGPIGGIGSGVRSDHGPWAGATRNIWKPTRQPGLWFHNGNFGLTRFFSRILALQIKARQAGLPTPVYGLA
jgi:putative flavoprotein involved in K+ transport